MLHMQRMLHQKYPCFGHKQIAVITHSSTSVCREVSVLHAFTLQTIVKLAKVFHKAQMENVCLDSKQCALPLQPTYFKRHNVLL